MTKVIEETNVSELLRVSAGESEPLRRLTEILEKRVEEEFKQLKLAQDLRQKPPQVERAASAAAS